MSGRGSETCPIDLTSDEASVKKINPIKKKKKSKEGQKAPSSSNKVQENNSEKSNLLLKRVDAIEEKIERAQNNADSSGCNNFVQQNETKQIIDQCGSLEHRIDNIEGFLNRLAQAFNVRGNQPCSNVLAGKSSADKGLLSRDPSPVAGDADLPPSEINASHSNPQNNVADNTELQTSEINAPHSNPQYNVADNTELETNLFSPGNMVLLNSQEIKFHESVDYSESCEGTDNYLEDSRITAEIAEQEEEEAVPCSTESETFTNIFAENSVANSNGHEIQIENEENILIQNSLHEDVKPLIPLPPLFSIKEEVDYLRDDQGRILMYLYCAAKKINRASSKISAVAGMYLTSTLHNEFTFQSERGLKEVKIEAEIRAALCGIEVIKSTFNSTADVCVMIISSCTWPHFVATMKSDKAYPNFYFCSCEIPNCEHSVDRWKTDHYVGTTQIESLPYLMLSKRGLRVHWCKLEQISKEEKYVYDAYKQIVDGVLEEIIDVINLPGIEITPVQN